jgi:hypothetical protein
MLLEVQEMTGSKIGTREIALSDRGQHHPHPCCAAVRSCATAPEGYLALRRLLFRRQGIMLAL